MDMCITPIAHSNQLIATMTHGGQLFYIIIRCTQGSQPNFLSIDYLVSQLSELQHQMMKVQVWTSLTCEKWAKVGSESIGTCPISSWHTSL